MASFGNEPHLARDDTTDVLLTVGHGSQPTTPLPQAFTSRFARGFLGTNVALPIHPILSGILVGILVSLPERSAASKVCGGIIGSGVIFGALVGLAVMFFVKPA